jgi:hypothetical protein
MVGRLQADVVYSLRVLAAGHRRTGKADEIGYTALFLASDESSYITWTDIVVDGGWFSSAPYLGNERSHRMLELLHAKEELREKTEEAKDLLKRFL